MSNENLYLAAVVAMHRVKEGPQTTPERIRCQLAPALRRWGGRYLESVSVAGSYAKGTAIRGVTLMPNDVDVDLFLSLSPDAPDSVAAYQGTLGQALREYQPLMGNVALKLLVGSMRVDLTVGRRIEGSRAHTLWQHRLTRRIRTNVEEQIRFVRESGRRDDILAAKIWRRKQGLYFPSFCLELAVIEALERSEGAECGAVSAGTVAEYDSAPLHGSAPLSERFMKVLEWLSTELPTAVLRDPANKSNVVSDLMTEAEKWRVANAAWMSLRAERWEEVV